MQTKHLCVLIHIWTKGEVGAPLNRFKPSSKIFYWPFQGNASFVDHLCYFCLVLLWFHARLFVDALWSPAGKGLISWLSFVMSNCDVVTFPLVSWVRCGAWLYLFLIFALFLTFTTTMLQVNTNEVYLLKTMCISVLTVSCCNLILFLLLPVKCISQRHRHTVKKNNIKTSTKEDSLYTCLKAG